LAGTLLGWLGALVTSGAQQDRERLIRQRSIARALYSELGRIKASLGDRAHGPDLSLVFEMNVGIPQLDPIFRPLFTELAAVESAICTDGLDLERALLWFKSASEWSRNATLSLHVQRDRADQATVALEDQRRYLDPILPEHRPLLALLEADVERTQKELANATGFWEMTDRQETRARATVWGLVDSIDERLGSLAHLSIPSLARFAVERALPRATEDSPPLWQRYADDGIESQRVASSAGR
jgi:hypothetical protein